MDPEIILASLNNEAHGWTARGRNVHAHTEYRPVGSGDTLSFVAVAHEMRTYQVQSEPLDMALVLQAEFENGALESVTVIYRSSNLDVTSAALVAKLDAMAMDALAAAEADLVEALAP